MIRDSDGFQRVAGPLSIIAITLVVYSGAFGFGFVNFDDKDYVEDNQRVLTGLTTSNVVWAFTTTTEANWHPLTWLSLMLDAEIGGAKPRVYHTTNVILHLLSSLLLLYLLESLTGRRGRSAVVALLFAVHPLHVESVAWISERKDVLSALLGLLALIAYARYVRAPGAGRYALVFVTYAAGLMAKPMLVTLPLLLLLFDVWPLGRWARLRTASPRPRVAWLLVRDKLPLAVLALLSSAMTLWAQATGGSITGVDALSAGQRLANSIVSYAAYVGKTFWPFRLSPLYPHPGDGLSVLLIVACATFLLLATIFAVGSLRRAPYVTFGWLWYVISLVPVIGWVQVGVQAMADRYAYLPSIGLFVVLVWGVPHLLEAAGALRRLHKPLILVVGTITLLLAVRARDQVRHWRDSVALFEHALAVTERNARAHNGLGMALHASGRPAEALEQFRRAVSIAPAYGDARASLAAALVVEGRFEEARTHFDAALRLNPRDAVCRTNLATMLMKQERLKEAEEQFLVALEIRPDDASAHKNLGAVLARRGEFERALHHFGEALRLEPEDVGTQHNLERARELLRGR